MAAEAVVPPEPAEPLRLVVFSSTVSGRCRRVDSLVAQVLQRRRNHRTFSLVKVLREEQPSLAARFRIREWPTLVVLEGKRVAARLDNPGTCREIETFLRPWLK